MKERELRALADALSSGTHYVESPELHETMMRAADYLRACADAQPTHPAPAAPQADIWRLRECAQRLVDGARWGLAGALSPSSKAREIPSSAWSDVKSRHLASLRDALAAPQAEQPIDLDAVAMQQMQQAAAESTWMPAEYSGSDWISDVCRWLRDGPPQAEPKREDRPVRDLLAIIHCDGGHHTEAVGLDQSIKDAQAAVCELKRELAMGKREPLSDDWIIDTANAINAALPFDTDEQAGLLQIARAVERAHGISGGSDAE